MRHFSFIDRCIQRFDQILAPKFSIDSTIRSNPAHNVKEETLTPPELRKAQGLMRVNHVGEVCAQALYQGQAQMARASELQAKLNEAAQEENDHLVWCAQRLNELNTHTSYLNPIWYRLSWLLGFIAGVLGDKLSLGFLAETERQVERHLIQHLHQLPENDKKSRAIVEQMRLEEAAHAVFAEQSGGMALPTMVQKLMQNLSKIMTHIAYYI